MDCKQWFKVFVWCQMTLIDCDLEDYKFGSYRHKIISYYPSNVPIIVGTFGFVN